MTPILLQQRQQVPRVRLFSEPELPQAERRAWLVLGRCGANGGAEAAVFVIDLIFTQSYD